MALGVLRPPYVLPDDCFAARDCLSMRLVDIEYLAGELDTVSQNISGTIKMVREQMELSQSFRSTVLTLVLAVYVPMAFASVGPSFVAQSAPTSRAADERYSRFSG